MTVRAVKPLDKFLGLDTVKEQLAQIEIKLDFLVKGRHFVTPELEKIIRELSLRTKFLDRKVPDHQRRP